MLSIIHKTADEEIKHLNCLCHVVNFALAVGFVLLFSKTTSPLFHGLSGDSSMFLLIGRGITEGLVPYKDLLENKGPLLFLIEALPQYIIDGPRGVFVLQCILIFIELCLIDRMYKNEYMCLKYSYILKIVFLAMFTLVYRNGNMAEEYNLFINILCLSFMKAVFDRAVTDKMIYAFSAWGVFTGAVILIKMNDAAGTIAMCIVIFFYYGWKRHFKVQEWIGHIGKFAVSYIIGIILILILVCLYYVKNNAMGDMLYGYLKLNFSMVYEGGIKASMSKRVTMLLQPYGVFGIMPVLIICISCLINWNRKEVRMKRIGMFFVGCSTVIATYTHITGFQQHLIPIVLTWLIAAFCILYDFANISANKIICMLGGLACGGYIFCYFAFSLTKSVTGFIHRDFIWRDNPTEDRLIAEIPEEYYDSVFIIGGRSAWFYENNMYPAYKWLNLGSFISHMGIKVAEEFEEVLKDHPVKYLIMPNGIDAHYEILTPETIIYIQENYILQSQVDNDYIYVLK